MKNLHLSFALLLLVLLSGCFNDDVKPGLNQLLSEGLNHVYPESGYLGDTVTLVHPGFANLSNEPEIYFDNIVSKNIIWNDTSLQCIVPIKSRNVRLPIKIRNDSLIEIGVFHLKIPIITGTDLENYTFGETVIIQGEHFNNVKIWNDTWTELRFDNIEVPIISITNTEIETKFPILDQYKNQLEINLRTRLFSEVESNDVLIKLRPPTITHVPDTIRTGERINISGKGFHVNGSVSAVYFNGVPWSHNLYGENDSTVSVDVQNVPFPNKRVEIAVELYGLKSTNSLTSFIDNDWRMLVNDLPFRHLQGWGYFTLGDHGYVVGFEESTEEIFLWDFNSNDRSFSKIQLPQRLIRDGYNYNGDFTGNGTLGFYYTGNENNDFYAFHPENNSWEKLAPFPGGRRDNAATFTIGEDIYVGMGILDRYEEYEDFYKYNYASNEWIQISDFSELRWSRSDVNDAPSFTIDGKGYVEAGDLYEYDPVNDIWSVAIQLNSNSYSYRESVGFTFDGKGIFISNASNVYDPQDQSFEALENIGLYHDSYPYVFSFDDEIYVGYSDYYHSSLFILDNKNYLEEAPLYR